MTVYYKEATNIEKKLMRALTALRRERSAVEQPDALTLCFDVATALIDGPGDVCDIGERAFWRRISDFGYRIAEITGYPEVGFAADPDLDQLIHEIQIVHTEIMEELSASECDIRSRGYDTHF